MDSTHADGPHERRAEELLARLLGGDPLSPDDRRELLETLRRDEALRRWVLDDVELDGLLRGLGWSAGDADAFAGEVGAGLAAERDARPFVAAVEREIRARVAARPEPRRLPRRYLLPALVSTASALSAGVWLLKGRKSARPRMHLNEAGACAGVLKLVDDYRADRLDQEVRREIQSHLGICASCRKRYQ